MMIDPTDPNAEIMMTIQILKKDGMIGARLCSAAGRGTCVDDILNAGAAAIVTCAVGVAEIGRSECEPAAAAERRATALFIMTTQAVEIVRRMDRGDGAECEVYIAKASRTT